MYAEEILILNGKKNAVFDINDNILRHKLSGLIASFEPVWRISKV